MVVAAFTIGSFGDILAVLQLAWQIRESLSDAAAASEEIQTLIADIDSFTHALQSARATLERTLHIPQSVLNGVAHVMRVCSALLRQVQAKVSARQKELVKKHGARIWRGAWAACAWEILGGKADVEKMKRRLLEQTVALQILLSVLQSAALVQIDKRAEEDRTTMKRMLQLLEAIPALMKFDEVPFHRFPPDRAFLKRGAAPAMRLTLEQFLVVVRLSLMLQGHTRSAKSDGHDYPFVPRNELQTIHFPTRLPPIFFKAINRKSALIGLLAVPEGTDFRVMHGITLPRGQVSRKIPKAFNLHYYRYSDPRFFGQDVVLISSLSSSEEYWTTNSSTAHERFGEALFQKIRLTHKNDNEIYGMQKWVYATCLTVKGWIRSPSGELRSMLFGLSPEDIRDMPDQMHPLCTYKDLFCM